MIDGKAELTAQEQKEFSKFIKEHTLEDELIAWYSSISKPNNFDDVTW